MAIYKSDLITAKDSRDISSKSLSGEKTGAQVLYATAEYMFGYPDAVTNDVIELADIPAGATVVPELSYVAKSFYYRDVRIALGDKAFPSRFGAVGTGATGISAGPNAFGYTDISHAYFGYAMASEIPRYAAATRVQATLLNMSESIPPGSKLRFGIAYRVQG